jgi:hypothetical protein
LSAKEAKKRTRGGGDKGKEEKTTSPARLKPLKNEKWRMEN